MTEALTVCCFELRGQWLGLDVADVLEIQANPGLLPVAGSPPYLAGLVNVRGEILTVLDLTCLLGGRAANPAGAGFLALLSWQGQNVCLLIDDPGEVREIPPGSLEPLPATADSALGLLGSAYWPGFGTGLVLLEIQMLFQPRFRELIRFYEARLS